MENIKINIEEYPEYLGDIYYSLLTPDKPKLYHNIIFILLVQFYFIFGKIII